jgi:hypothetical protein
VPAGERPLDPLLTLQQPVHRRQQFALGDLAERELVAERGLRKAAGRRQLRPRCDQPLDDHRDDQVTLPAALTPEQTLQIQITQHPQHRLDVTVRQRPRDLELIVQIDQPAPGEHRPDRVDDLRRQMRQVPEVLVTDLALSVAVGTAQ